MEIRSRIRTKLHRPPSRPLTPESPAIRIKHDLAMGLDAIYHTPVLGNLVLDAYGWATYPWRNLPDIGNFGRVGKHLFRGAQPSQAGFETLRRQGIDTIINLRPEEQWEKPWVEQAGLRYLYLPLANVDPPTFSQGLQFLRMATDPANGNVFVHCQHGADRTGAMAGIYRIAVDHWSPDQAVSEMFRYHFHQGWEDAKMQYVLDFGKKWDALPAAVKAQILHQDPARLPASPPPRRSP